MCTYSSVFFTLVNTALFISIMVNGPPTRNCDSECYKTTSIYIQKSEYDINIGKTIVTFNEIEHPHKSIVSIRSGNRTNTYIEGKYYRIEYTYESRYHKPDINHIKNFIPYGTFDKLVAEAESIQMKLTYALIPSLIISIVFYCLHYYMSVRIWRKENTAMLIYAISGSIIFIATISLIVTLSLYGSTFKFNIDGDGSVYIHDSVYIEDIDQTKITFSFIQDETNKKIDVHNGNQTETFRPGYRYRIEYYTNNLNNFYKKGTEAKFNVRPMKNFYLCLTILLPIIAIAALSLLIPSCYSYYLDRKQKNHIEPTTVEIILESTLPRNSKTPLARLPEDILRVIAKSDI